MQVEQLGSAVARVKVLSPRELLELNAREQEFKVRSPQQR
jgi:hypothetical protein